MGFTDEIRYMIEDWCKYMDTTTPRGADEKLYRSLKYTTRKKLQDFSQQHDIDRVLLEKVAISNFLLKSDEEILQNIKPYLRSEKQDKQYTQRQHKTRKTRRTTL